MASVSSSAGDFKGTRALWATVGLLGVTATTLFLMKQEERRRRRKKRRRLHLKFTSRYASGVVTEAAGRRGLSLDPDAHCQWGDFARLDWDRFLSGEIPDFRLSSLYLRAGLVRKGMLAHYLKKRKLEGVLPLGFAVDVEDEADLVALRKSLEDAESAHKQHFETNVERPTWIVKASEANQGEQLYLARSADEAVELVRAEALGGARCSEWVVQRYVHPPVLIHRRKFHLRAHLLLSGCPSSGTTRAWLHENSIVALVASEDYLDHAETGDGRGQHLTNHCIQVSHPAYNEAKQILLLEEVEEELKSPGLAAHVKEKIAVALGKALTAAGSAPATFAPLPQCFELMGTDFILEATGDDSKPDVHLLEVNAGPDLAVFGDRLRSNCVDLAADVLRVAVEPHMEQDEAPGSKFVHKPDSCLRSQATCGTGFGQCLWTFNARTSNASSELAAFKRRLSIAGQWAKALHEKNGIEVRGPQAECGS